MGINIYDSKEIFLVVKSDEARKPAKTSLRVFIPLSESKPGCCGMPSLIYISNPADIRLLRITRSFIRAVWVTKCMSPEQLIAFFGARALRGGNSVTINIPPGGGRSDSNHVLPLALITGLEGRLSRAHTHWWKIAAMITNLHETAVPFLTPRVKGGGGLALYAGSLDHCIAPRFPNDLIPV